MSANSDYLMIYRKNSVQHIIILFLSKKKKEKGPWTVVL